MKQQFLFYFLLLSYIAHAQKHDYIWHVGHEFSGDSSTIINFNQQPPSITVTYRNMPMFRSSTSMCDSSGNLQFYTNSIWINNAQYQQMQNGNGINPGQIANDKINSGYIINDGSIAIRHPNQANKYYLFHQSATYNSLNVGMGEYLYYTLINMNANNGLGTVEKKNQILASDSICDGQLEAVKHGNGKDWWLVQPISASNGFYIFLVTEDTVILTTKQYIGYNNRLGEYEWRGQAVFSPDGTKYARYDYKNDLDIFDFDRCSGLFSNSIHIPIQDTCDTFGGAGLGSGGGVAISPSGQYLYVSSLTQIYQFDLWSSNIPLSKKTVAVYDGFTDFLTAIFGFLQLAPDGKIYGYAGSIRYLHTIHNPDLGDTLCNVGQHDVFIHYYNGHFLPNFPHYRTPALVGSPCDTLTSIAQIPPQTPNIKIYPNPATTTITLESEQPMQRVLVYNALGQQVMSLSAKQQNLIELETSRLENGTYFVSIWINGKMIHKQFQILR